MTPPFFPYPITVAYSAKDEAYVGRVPALRYCLATGDTPEECAAETVKAATEVLAIMKQDGKPWPPHDTGTEAAELQASFSLRWDADQRARERWQVAHPEHPLTWPDHADMVLWLLGRIEAREARELRIAQALGLLKGQEPEPLAIHHETLAQLHKEGQITMLYQGRRVIVDDGLPQHSECEACGEKDGDHKPLCPVQIREDDGYLSMVTGSRSDEEQGPELPRQSCTCPERQPGPHYENPDCPLHGDPGHEPPEVPEVCQCNSGSTPDGQRIPNPHCPVHGEDPQDGQVPFPR